MKNINALNNVNHHTAPIIQFVPTKHTINKTHPPSHCHTPRLWTPSMENWTVPLSYIITLNTPLTPKHTIYSINTPFTTNPSNFLCMPLRDNRTIPLSYPNKLLLLLMLCRRLLSLFQHLIFHSQTCSILLMESMKLCFI